MRIELPKDGERLFPAIGEESAVVRSKLDVEALRPQLVKLFVS